MFTGEDEESFPLCNQKRFFHHKGSVGARSTKTISLYTQYQRHLLTHIGQHYLYASILVDNKRHEYRVPNTRRRRRTIAFYDNHFIRISQNKKAKTIEYFATESYNYFLGFIGLNKIYKWAIYYKFVAN